MKVKAREKRQKTAMARRFRKMVGIGGGVKLCCDCCGLNINLQSHKVPNMICCKQSLSANGRIRAIRAA